MIKRILYIRFVNVECETEMGERDREKCHSTGAYTIVWSCRVT